MSFFLRVGEYMNIESRYDVERVKDDTCLGLLLLMEMINFVRILGVLF